MYDFTTSIRVRIGRFKALKIIDWYAFNASRLWRVTRELLQF